MLFRIPMRLAISHFPGDAALDGLVYDGAHWSVRLAVKLLLERAQAAASPWHPYLQACSMTSPHWKISAYRIVCLLLAEEAIWNVISCTGSVLFPCNQCTDVDMLVHQLQGDPSACTCAACMECIQNHGNQWFAARFAERTDNVSIQ